jgi:hypothetical protein
LQAAATCRHETPRSQNEVGRSTRKANIAPSAAASALFLSGNNAGSKSGHSGYRVRPLSSHSSSFTSRLFHFFSKTKGSPLPPTMALPYSCTRFAWNDDHLCDWINYTRSSCSPTMSVVQIYNKRSLDIHTQHVECEFASARVCEFASALGGLTSLNAKRIRCK